MIYPTSLYNFGKVCQDSVTAGNILRALCKQAVQLTPAEETMLSMIQNDNEWMDERIEARKERDRQRQAAWREQQKAAAVTPGSTPSHDVTPNPRDTVSEPAAEKRGGFAKPTVEEISAYCHERMNKVDANAFFDFYESKGWKVGNASMRDWKAAVRTWEKRDAKDRKCAGAARSTHYREGGLDVGV